jgi:alkylhydroperoxidase/carboxymuconolactone decarboxylase family protein YurZ
MPNPTIKIYNSETGEEVERPMTKDEYTVHLADLASAAAIREEEAAKVSQKNAILERLGLTPEEASLLLA